MLVHDEGSSLVLDQYLKPLFETEYGIPMIPIKQCHSIYLNNSSRMVLTSFFGTLPFILDGIFLSVQLSTPQRLFQVRSTGRRLRTWG
jgi:hypothetical protein